MVSLLVVMFDATWGFYAARHHLPYERLWFVSFILYGTAGLAVVRSRRSARLLLAFAAGTSVGLVDATFGNLVAYRVGALPVQASGHFARLVIISTLTAPPLAGCLAVLAAVSANLFTTQTERKRRAG
jgi:hypothetical protein